ncbi:hypothetical protein [Pseudomonas sp. PB106]|uniref:hypothetical protein n=1 Tax=Pseudomonas sp. PB106 TaxID=2494699 RepID=UPI00131B9FF7|nr:hypothetical protein [Pseudomonas sp. PB106]KAE9642134.1 hypothetical protein EJA71_19755 [Pseudomonas sp. PB106]
MYKPPKAVPGTHSTTTSGSGAPATPDTVNIVPPRLAPETAPIMPRTDLPGAHPPDAQRPLEPVQAGAPTLDTQPANPGEVIVVDLQSLDSPNLPPDLVIVSPDGASDRMPIGDSGLFIDSGGSLYADVQGLGMTGISTDSQGQFVLASQSPHQDRLVLARIEGTSQWQTRSDPTPPVGDDWNVPVSAATTVPLKKLEISVFQQSFLTEPDARGTSWNVRGSANRKYVRIKDGGAVMVTRHKNGDVQAVSAQNPKVNGPMLERIGTTSLWQQKFAPTASGKRPAPTATESSASKRVRLEQPGRSATTPKPTGKRPRHNPDLWRTWGESEPVTSGSVRIGDLHYRTLPGASLTEAVIRPFSFPEGFDAFEGMLIAQPWRQPVRAVSHVTSPASNSTDVPTTQWTVSGPLFNKPLSQSIADTFKSFSEVTARTLARGLFAQALPDNVMTSPGLLRISNTLARWRGASTADTAADSSLHGFSDPLQLLPVFEVREVSGWYKLYLPLIDHGQPAHRVDFKLRQEDWNTFHDRTNRMRIRQLYRTLLIRSGYEVFLPSFQSAGATLVLKRAGQTYFMALRDTSSRTLAYDFPNDLYSSGMRSYLGEETCQVVISAHESNTLSWLVGGVHLTEARHTDFFIYRVSAPELKAARTPGSTGQPPLPHTRSYPSQAARPTQASLANRDIPVEAAPPLAVSIDGERHTLLPRATDDMIVYIDDPAHPARSFDSLETLLHIDKQHQPRGAIRVPPENVWKIDPFMAFEKPMKASVAEYFPTFSSLTLHNVAKHQFKLANGSTTTTGAGLTALRQTFNDWRVGNPAPRAELAEPLLMLPTLPITPASGQTLRKLVVPEPASGDLMRIDLEVNYYRDDYDYFLAHPGGLNLKVYMADMLRRTGYRVLLPNGGNAWPALVFTRDGHDRVFFLSLYRTRDNFIPLPLTPDPRTASTLIDRIGTQASQVLLEADAGGKVVWLKGGIQQTAGMETVFIVRDDIPMI